MTARATQVLARLFRMGDQIDKMVHVTLDFEIETPAPIDPGLPDVPRFIVLLGPQGRMAEVLEEEGDTAVNGALDGRGGVRVACQEALGVDGAHYRFRSFFASLWRERIASFAEENGP